jgi:transglutaminase-like putative cysteine protease
MLIEVVHKTKYRYDAPARYSIQSLRLEPPAFDAQRIVSWSVTAPGIESGFRFVDCFGNAVVLASIATTHDSIEIEARGVVETLDCSGVARGLPDSAPLRVYLRTTPKTSPSAGLIDLARHAQRRTVLETLHELMQAVSEAVVYEIGTSHQHTTAADALASGHGVCQDHAQVFITAARVLGIPSRYVNGYFLSGTLAPAEAHHAWAEAWVEGLGWVGFDPANRCCPTERYVRLACGLDAASAAPIRGTQRGGADEALDVEVEVQQQGSQQ